MVEVPHTLRKARKVCVDGAVFTVEPRIVRLEGERLRGWQVRYRGTRLFSDGQYGDDAAGALRAAQQWLRGLYRDTPPAALTLPTETAARKTSDLPVGISGPVWRWRGNGESCEFKVSAPVSPGTPPRVRSVYIGTTETWVARYDKALELAIERRREAVENYEQEQRRHANLAHLAVLHEVSSAPNSRGSTP